MSAGALRRASLSLVCLLALFSLLSAAAPTAAQDRRIVHQTPSTLPAGEAWECAVPVPEGDWVSMDLFHRRAGESVFTLEGMRYDRGAFRATVAASAVSPPFLEYYLAGQLTSGVTVTLPIETPRQAPLRVPVEAGVGGILILSPEQGEQTASATPDIAVLFDPPLADESRVAFFLDGEELTGRCETSIDFLLYAPATPLAAGAHEASIVTFPESGAPSARSWRFSVLEAGQKPSVGAAAGAGANVFGRWEAGWARVSADAKPDAFIPYDETSDVSFYGSVDASRGATSFHADASRDPIYDDEIRATARLDRPGLRLEAGDIYPFFSELSVAWQSGKGGFASLERGRFGAALFGIRTLAAENFEGFGTYSQFLYGSRGTARFGANRAGVAFAYGHDRKGSIPDSTRIIDPQVNRVAAVSLGRRFHRRVDLEVELAHSSTSDPQTEAAEALRIVATLGDPGVNELKLEYHDYGVGFLTLGSPTVQGGERGVVIDGAARLPWRLRASGQAEIYTDRDIFLPLRDGEPIVQLTSRLDRGFSGRAGSITAYLFGRYHDVPSVDFPYENRYATLGLFAQRGVGSLSGSVTRSRTETITTQSDTTATGASSDTLLATSLVDEVEREWTVTGNASASALFGFLTPRVGARWTGSERTIRSGEDRWTLTAELTATWRRFTLSTEYQRIENAVDRGATPEELQREYVEHLVSVSGGRSF